MALAKTRSTDRPQTRKKPSSVSFVQLRSALGAFWRGLREWCGDAAYEKYLRAAATQDSGCEKLTPSEFYVDQLNRRYSRPSRCC